MSKHTPGYWEVNVLDDGSETGEIVIWEHENGEVIGSEIIVPVIYFDDEKSKANANLIAAAPDLLEALEGIMSAIDCDDLVARDESIGSDSGDHVYSVVKTARAAIARAKGESQ